VCDADALARTLIQIVPAEPGWRALFGLNEDEFVRSRVVAWALTEASGAQEIVGLIVDPSLPTRIIPVSEAVDPDGGTFMRYGFVES